MATAYPTIATEADRLVQAQDLASKTLGEAFIHSREPPLDWHLAVDAATARLNEKPGPQDTMAHPMVAAMAIELATRLCAYCMVADEADHMRTGLAEQTAGSPPPNGIPAASRRG